MDPWGLGLADAGSVQGCLAWETCGVCGEPVSPVTALLKESLGMSPDAEAPSEHSWSEEQNFLSSSGMQAPAERICYGRPRAPILQRATNLDQQTADSTIKFSSIMLCRADLHTHTRKQTLKPTQCLAASYNLRFCTALNDSRNL